MKLIFSNLNLNPVHLLIFFILNNLFAFIWLTFYLFLDRKEPEPKREILRIFFWGSFIVLPVLLITGPIAFFLNKINYNKIVYAVIFSFLIDGLIEEFAKFIVISEKVFSSKYFDEIRDGLIYGMTVGLGFAFLENIFYSLLFKDLKEGIFFVSLRNITSTFMHFLSAGIIGFHFSVVKFFSEKKSKLKKKILLSQGLFLAILFHGTYNALLRFESNWCIFPLIILLIGSYSLIFYNLRKAEKIKKLSGQKVKLQ
jgi:RsiW-degrading membrane proteinase PrsW (M82 family)